MPRSHRAMLFRGGMEPDACSNLAPADTVGETCLATDRRERTSQPSVPGGTTPGDDRTRAPVTAPDPGGRLGTRLRSRRRMLGLTQKALAQLVGRHQSVVSRWESDDLPLTPGELVDIADALAVDADDLLHRSRLPGDSRIRSSRSREVEERRRLGLRLAAARRRLAIDPVSMWRLSTITPYRLGRIERGHDPSLEELRRLLAVLDVPLPVACGHRS